MKNFKSLLLVFMFSFVALSFNVKDAPDLVEDKIENVSFVETQNATAVQTIVGTEIVARTLFCQGFEDGYKEGYCDGRFGCIPPVCPVCPVTTIYERTDNYKDGYNRGFKRGLADK
jgi:hypothetical protein